MASFVRKAAAFAWSFWPIILFYVLVTLIVTFGVLRHPVQHTYLPNGSSETVPHEVSCFVRNGFAENDDADSEGSFCQPKEFNI